MIGWLVGIFADWWLKHIIAGVKRGKKENLK